MIWGQPPNAIETASKMCYYKVNMTDAAAEYDTYMVQKKGIYNP